MTLSLSPVDPISHQANFQVHSVFNLLLPRMLERLTPISLSGLRRLNRGSCCTPKFAHLILFLIGLSCTFHSHTSIRSCNISCTHPIIKLSIGIKDLSIKG